MIRDHEEQVKYPPIMGIFCVPKPLVVGFGCDELVLYDIRELA